MRSVSAAGWGGWLRRRLPAPLRRLGGSVLDRLDPLVLFGHRCSGTLREPVPPRRLRARVGEPGALAYLESGRRVAAEIESVLAAAGRDLSAMGDVLDFGAGSGRVLTRLRVGPSAAVSASDVDAEACRWLAAHHPVIARPCAPLPPAPFPDDAFDLVVAVSVFTHLSEGDQDLWLAEIARVLRPGGMALLSVMGPGLLEAYREGRRPGMSAAQRELLGAEPLAAAGIVFAAEPLDRWNAGRYPGTASSYGLTFHAEEYVREHWSRHLEVLDVVPSALNWGQDAVLCSALRG